MWTVLRTLLVALALTGFVGQAAAHASPTPPMTPAAEAAMDMSDCCPDCPETGAPASDPASKSKVPLGFDLDAIRSLLDLADHPERPCGEANAIAERHLADVRLKIFQLQALQAELSRMTAECAGGRVSACKVIEVLHDPAPRLEAPV